MTAWSKGTSTGAGCTKAGLSAIQRMNHCSVDKY